MISSLFLVFHDWTSVRLKLNKLITCVNHIIIYIYILIPTHFCTTAAPFFETLLWNSCYHSSIPEMNGIKWPKYEPIVRNIWHYFVCHVKTFALKLKQILTELTFIVCNLQILTPKGDTFSQQYYPWINH